MGNCNPPYKNGVGNLSWCDCSCSDNGGGCFKPECYDTLNFNYNCSTNLSNCIFFRWVKKSTVLTQINGCDQPPGSEAGFVTIQLPYSVPPQGINLYIKAHFDDQGSVSGDNLFECSQPANPNFPDVSGFIEGCFLTTGNQIELKVYDRINGYAGADMCICVPGNQQYFSPIFWKNYPPAGSSQTININNWQITWPDYTPKIDFFDFLKIPYNFISCCCEKELAISAEDCPASAACAQPQSFLLPLKKEKFFFKFDYEDINENYLINSNNNKFKNISQLSDNCSIEFSIGSTCCCLEYLSGGLPRAVGDGSVYINGVSSEDCCPSLRVLINNQTAYYNGEYYAIMVKDGDYITISVLNNCGCNLITKTPEGYNPPDCPGSGFKKPYKILKTSQSGKYKILFNNKFFGN